MATEFSQAARAAAALSARSTTLHPHGTGGRFSSTDNEPFTGGSTVAAPAMRGKERGIRGDDYIHVHVTSNPKTRGNKNYDRFKEFKNGMTVQDYIDAVAARHGHDRRGALGDILHDVRKGYLSVVDKAAGDAAIAAVGGDVEKGLAAALGGKVPAAAPKAPVEAPTAPAVAARTERATAASTHGQHTVGGVQYSGDHTLHGVASSNRLNFAGVREGGTLDAAHAQLRSHGYTSEASSRHLDAAVTDQGASLRPPGSAEMPAAVATPTGHTSIVGTPSAGSGHGTHVLGGTTYSGDHVLSAPRLTAGLSEAGIEDGDTLDVAHGKLTARGHTPAQASRKLDQYVTRGAGAVKPPGSGPAEDAQPVHVSYVGPQFRLGNRDYAGDTVIIGEPPALMQRYGVRSGDNLNEIRTALSQSALGPAVVSRDIQAYARQSDSRLLRPDAPTALAARNTAATSRAADARAKQAAAEAAIAARGGKAIDRTPSQEVPKEGTPEREFHDGILTAAAAFGPEASVTLRYSSQGKAQGFRVDTGQPGDSISRSMDQGAGWVSHDFFRIGSQANRGNGAAKKFLAGSVEAYKKVGIKQVEVHANIDVGGYAWAKYGFKPNTDSEHGLANQVGSRLQQLKDHSGSGLTDDMIEGVAKLIRQRDFHALADVQATVRPFSGYGNPVKDVAIGKHLLLGTDWYGTLNMTDPASMARFTAYATPKSGD